MSLKMKRISWVQMSRAQASSRPESVSPEPKCPEPMRSVLQSSKVQTMGLESSFSGMPYKTFVPFYLGYGDIPNDQSSNNSLKKN